MPRRKGTPVKKRPIENIIDQRQNHVGDGRRVTKKRKAFTKSKKYQKLFSNKQYKRFLTEQQKLSQKTFKSDDEGMSQKIALNENKSKVSGNFSDSDIESDWFYRSCETSSSSSSSASDNDEDYYPNNFPLSKKLQCYVRRTTQL